ncbi:VRR-NUC domain-containing protein [Ferrimonas gelatinilytica]|uniref:phosphodiesterase I n=1 Tax=Ferrimonas gelatinilytica TaxID=1255257 RepID=A0ABP9SDA0_9GAMM
MLPLPQDYYRRHFLRVVDHVRRHRRALMSDALVQWLERFEQVDAEAQCLLLRLLARKGPLFRTDKLHYDEVPEVQVALDALKRQGLVQSVVAIEGERLAELLSLDELKSLPALTSPGPRKRDWQEMLSAMPARPWRAWWPSGNGEVITLTARELLQELEMLFFANGRQSLTDLVLTDIGQHHYVLYPVSEAHFPFHHRDEVQQALRLYALESRWAELGKVQLGDEAHLRQPQTNARLERQRQRLLAQIARQWEREGNPDRALTLLAHCHTPLGRERRLRLLFGSGRYAEAQPLALAMLALPEGEEERQLALRFLGRLKKHLPLVMPLPRPHKPVEVNARLPLGGVRIESRVVALLRAQGLDVWHCENALVPGVAALVLWQVIFRPLPGAFVHPFQSGPLDLFHPLFVVRRRSAIEAELARWLPLSRTAFSERLLERYDAFAHQRCALVQPKRFGRDLLARSAQCLAPAQWIALIRHLLFDLRQNRAGMPDLVVIQQEKLLWLEVKGPHDRLRDNQRRWLAALQRAEQRAGILNLEEKAVMEVPEALASSGLFDGFKKN